MTKFKQDRTRKGGYLGSLNIQDPHPDRPPQEPWTGAHDQTLEYFKRVINTAIEDIEDRERDHDKHFDVTLRKEAVKALAKWKLYLSWIELDKVVPK